MLTEDGSFTMFVCVSRLPTLLLRDSSGDVQEGDELAGNADFPPGSSHFREGKGSNSQVQVALLAQLSIYTLSCGRRRFDTTLFDVIVFVYNSTSGKFSSVDVT